MDWKELSREDLEYFCAMFYADMLGIKQDILFRNYGEALETIAANERRVTDLKMATTDGKGKILPIDRKLAMYQRMYVLLFNAIRSALEAMEEKHYEETEKILKYAHCKAEEIYIESGNVD